ncbi:MAG: hypothetical protein U1F49_03890 [Rubrivivax sp.]
MRWRKAASALTIEQARRRHQQPVQAGDRQALVGGDARQLARARLADLRRVVGERERRHLEPVVAERRGERALLLERQRPQHLVAQRDLHAAASP